MSLSQQMIIFIGVLLFSVLLGTFASNFNQTKEFLEEQLESHSQDTATSLGLSLSSIGDPEDIPSMETMINAVFDRGYYAEISLVDMDGQMIYQRLNPSTIEGIPGFFINMIEIVGPKTEAMVQGGWVPIGKLKVQSHTGYAYSVLWTSAKSLTLWFFISMLISTLIAVYILRLLLKPMKTLEKQAEAIVNKEYILQEKLPKTTELRSIVSAMNGMVSRMKVVFERDAQNAQKLQKMAYQDSVTGLSNRLHFEMNVDSLLEKNDDNVSGAMMLIRVNGLKELNDQYGYLLGDKLMQALAKSMQTHMTNCTPLLARLNGTELVAVIPAKEGSDVIKTAEKVAESTPNTLIELKADEAPTNISVAVIDYEPGNRRGPLLAKMDFAIAESCKLGENKAFYYQLEEESEKENKNIQWQNIIDDAINHKRFVLFEQSAYHYDHSIQNKELFIRLKDQDGTIHSAGYFMPAVSKLNRIAEIDKLVIELAFKHLSSHPTENKLAINLTQSIIETDGIKNWLLQNLTLETAAKLAFEMPEKIINSAQETSWPLIKALKERGMTFGIDNFGGQFGNMSYLQDVRPDYIKLDASFSKAIERDEQTRSYIQSLFELCQSLDIQIIAMSVETESQIEAFKELGIDYFQGYFYGAPQPL